MSRNRNSKVAAVCFIIILGLSIGDFFISSIRTGDPVFIGFDVVVIAAQILIVTGLITNNRNVMMAGFVLYAVLGLMALAANVASAGKYQHIGAGRLVIGATTVLPVVIMLLIYHGKNIPWRTVIYLTIARGVVSVIVTMDLFWLNLLEWIIAIVGYSFATRYLHESCGFIDTDAEDDDSVDD